MKFLVLSITAGQGHNMTASAIKEGFESLGHDCLVLDTYEYISHMLAVIIDKGYLTTTKHMDTAYAKVYKWLEERKFDKENFSIVRMSNVSAAKKLYGYIEEYNPDALFVTHSFAAVLVDIIKEKFDLKCKTYGVVTDFCMHPFWEGALGLDYVICPNELMYVQCLKKGFKKEQFLPFGIPIKLKFAQKNDKKALCEKYGLDFEKLTLLVMGGSMGFGDIEETVTMLDNFKYDFQIIVVCGSNKKSYKALCNIQYKKNIIVLGYVDYIDELMECADGFITKPGGLTTSEALAKNLPLIIINPIPGIEDRNTDFLCNNGIAMKVTPAYDLQDIIYQYFAFPEKIKCMKENAVRIAKPNSALNLCKFAINNVVK